MSKKLWLFQLPVIGIFLSCFVITELGESGNLDSAVLRERVLPILSRAPNALTDFKFKMRGFEKIQHRIVIVEIDSPSIETLGRWPWHRDVMSYLIEKTFQSGAKVVGLDAVFSEPDQRVPPELAEVLKQRNMPELIDQFETDQTLQKVIEKYSDRLVLGWISDAACQPANDGKQNCPVTDPNAISQFPEGYEKFSLTQFTPPAGFDPSQVPFLSFVTPIPNLQRYNQVAKHVGYLNAALDTDGYIRRTNIIAMAKGKPFPSLPLEMARIALNEKLQLTLGPDHAVQSVGFMDSGRNIPVSRFGTMQINFRGPSETVTRLSALEVMSEKDTIEDSVNRRLAGLSKLDVLHDALVLIGITALGVHDMRQFPFESNSAGVDGHAHILDNLLTGDPLLSGSGGMGSIWVLGLMLLGVLIFAIAVNKLDAIPALGLFIASLLILGLIDVKWLFQNNYNWNTSYLYLEIVTIFVFTLAMKYIMEEQSKKFLRGAFTKYVSSDVVDSIMKDPKKLSLGGEKREMSIMFSDIRSFTTFSEKMDAKALASFLNDYLGIMTGIVFKNQGTLDKYIGDAVMAFWGAPLDQPNHSQNACKAAAEMMDALHNNQARFKSQYGIDVEIGIGINSGVVNVGNMGSDNNFEYTVIGDHVNLASRVEGLTKKYGVHILTTRFTFECMQKASVMPLPHRILDDVKVKGKKKAVELIEILDRPMPEEGLQNFNDGRRLYQQCRWNEAIQKFTDANRLLAPQGAGDGAMDGPCEIFLERCANFKKTPPEEGWDGSWEMDSK